MKIPATQKITAIVLFFMIACTSIASAADAKREFAIDQTKKALLDLQRAIIDVRNANLQLCKAGNETGCAMAKVNEMELIQIELEWTYESGSKARYESDELEEVRIALDDVRNALNALSFAIESIESDDEW